MSSLRRNSIERTHVSPSPRERERLCPDRRTLMSRWGWARRARHRSAALRAMGRWSASRCEASGREWQPTARSVSGSTWRYGSKAVRLAGCVWFVGMSLVASIAGRAATIAEDFGDDPRFHGWRAIGDTNLFGWNATNRSLEVTWDSSRTNSFFHLPLGTVLTKADDFSLAFDLRMRDIAIGTSTNRPDTFELALGLMNSTNLSHVNYFRGAGVNATYGVRHTVEFDYFPPTAVIQATFAPTVIASNNAIKFSDNHPLELTTNDLFRIVMSYTASNQTLKTTVTRNGAAYGLPPSNTLKDLVLTNHPDFRVDRLAIMNYSDAVQIGPTQYWGSIRAHGTVDNLAVTIPEPPVANLAGVRTNGGWQATFVSRTNWFYALERTTNVANWSVVSPTNAGTGGSVVLQDSNPPGAGAFYRVRAWRP